MTNVQSKQTEQTSSRFVVPSDWVPVYSKWRHGGWYVHNVRRPGNACGCVSRNYKDGKWRIVCDDRRGNLGEEGDYTFKTRDEAARAEYLLALELHAAEEAKRVEGASAVDFDSMGLTELAAWYEQSVGYNPVEDDPETTEEGLRAICKELAETDTVDARRATDEAANTIMPDGYVLNDFGDGSFGWELDELDVYEDGFSSPNDARAAAVEHSQEAQRAALAAPDK